MPRQVTNLTRSRIESETICVDDGHPRSTLTGSGHDGGRRPVPPGALPTQPGTRRQPDLGEVANQATAGETIRVLHKPGH
jgi:hypothetical protein